MSDSTLRYREPGVPGSPGCNDRNWNPHTHTIKQQTLRTRTVHSSNTDFIFEMKNELSHGKVEVVHVIVSGTEYWSIVPTAL